MKSCNGWGIAAAVVCVGVLVSGDARGATFSTEANVFNEVTSDMASDNNTTGSIQSTANLTPGTGVAQASENGTLNTSAVLDDFFIVGAAGGTRFDPASTLEANAISNWSETVTNDTGSSASYSAALSVIQPFLEVHDLTGYFIERAEPGASGQPTGFVAEVAIQVKLDGTPIYDIEGRLDAVGPTETFTPTVNANPQGAALPNWMNTGDGNAGNFHQWQANTYDVLLDLGEHADGESFTLEYMIYALATSPGDNDDGFYVEAEIGDPFDIQGEGNNPLIIRRTNEVANGTAPEPSTLALAGLGLMTLTLRRRSRVDK